MSLWTAKDASLATGGVVASDWAAGGVSIDTRTLQPGDLFVALTDVRDGHDFVAQALGKGAAAALVSRVPEGVPAEKLLIVDDVLPALEQLGAAARARTSARVIAVTGSVGKTSTKEMLRTVLSRQGRTHASVASYNNHWGVPLTLARMPADTEYAVIEIGMNHPGEIAPLSRLTRPHVAMITNISGVHLEAFSDGIAGIAREKRAIVAGLEAADDRLGLVWCTDIAAEAYEVLDAHQDAGVPEIRYGTASDGPWQLRHAQVVGETTVVDAVGLGGPLRFKISAPGPHYAINGLGVLAAVAALGADPALAAVDLAEWRPVEGRGMRERRSLDPNDPDLSFDLIDDAFNASPASMVPALAVLSGAVPRDGVGRVTRGRRIAVLGDMLELGPDEIALHAALAKLPSLQALDVVHCVGPHMRALYDVLPAERRGLWTETASELAETAGRLIDAGDVVLVKGSKGSKVSQVVEALRKLSAPAEKEDDK